MNREDVYRLIDGEREHQDRVWQGDEYPEGSHSPTEWLVFIEYYLAESRTLATVVPTHEANIKIMDNIRKIGAMCVAAMEENETNPRIEKK